MKHIKKFGDPVNEAVKDDKQRLEDAVRSAEESFWDTIAEEYPEISSGDLDPGTVMDLIRSMESAVNTWLMFNDPTDTEMD